MEENFTFENFRPIVLITRGTGGVPKPGGKWRGGRGEAEGKQRGSRGKALLTVEHGWTVVSVEEASEDPRAGWTQHKTGSCVQGASRRPGLLIVRVFGYQ